MTNVTLSQDDKVNLLSFLEQYSARVSKEDLIEINDKLDKKIRHIKGSKNLASYVLPMLKQIKKLAYLLDSNDAAPSERNRVIAALHYFVWAEDKMPDYLPVVGYLDDAFIISVVYDDVKKYLK